MTGPGIETFEVAGRRIAYRKREGAGPTLLFLPGYASDMEGTKALALDGFAERRGLAMLRLDYSGTGSSAGSFENGTLAMWLEEVLAAIDLLTEGPVVVIGSSMGGWIALRLAQELAKRQDGPKLAGMVLIAPAPDFTSDLIEPNLTKKEKASLAERGYFEERSAYSPEPNIYTRTLMEDGRDNSVLNGIIETGCPVHILQGMKDPDVPYQHAMKLVEHLPADDVVLTFVRDGDHRLSRPQDIERMLAAVKGLIR